VETSGGSVKVQSETTSSNRSLEPILSLHRNLDYRRVLVPHDGLEMSDKALAHAIALSKKASDSEILLLNVVDYVDNIPPSVMLSYVKEGEEKGKERFRNDVEEGIRHLLEQRADYCKKTGGIKQTTYEIAHGKVADEIIRVAEQRECDIIVMASSRIPSFIRALGSTARKVVDNSRKPVLIIHE
jgi:nucleotide-binding universal stress UspA family protein